MKPNDNYVKKSSSGSINETKRRVRDEFNQLGYFCWITEEKEIDNYLPSEAVNAVHSSHLAQIDQYEVFPEYIDKQGKYFSTHKVESARKYAQYMTKENSEAVLDLRDRIEGLYKSIVEWNR